LSLEEAIVDGLGDLGIVDGHDIGPDEMNLLIDTDEPLLAFQRIRLLLDPLDYLRDLKAGYPP
jgi:hypothetical protein